MQEEHRVDTDVPPQMYAWANLSAQGTRHRGIGCVQLEKRANGHLYVNGAKVTAYLSPHQRDTRGINGHELRMKLEESGVLLLNATLYAYLYEHRDLIPDDWDGYIDFWGTIVADTECQLFVMCLSCRNGQSRGGGYRELDKLFDTSRSAACLES